MQKLAIFTYVMLVLSIPAEAVLTGVTPVAAPGSASSETVVLMQDMAEVLALSM